jgi:hypothetical protein
MDMSKYASKRFIKPEDLASGPQRKTIVAIEPGRYDKPVATFSDNTQLSLNGTNVSTLLEAFGSNEKDWLKQRVELFAGTLRYNGNNITSVLVRALETVPAADRTPPEPQPDLNDEIPF